MEVAFKKEVFKRTKQQFLTKIKLFVRNLTMNNHPVYTLRGWEKKWPYQFQKGGRTGTITPGLACHHPPNARAQTGIFHFLTHIQSMSTCWWDLQSIFRNCSFLTISTVKSLNTNYHFPVHESQLFPTISLLLYTSFSSQQIIFLKQSVSYLKYFQFFSIVGNIMLFCLSW